MELQTLTPHIRYLPHDPQRDRPMLACIQGQRHTLAIDAGYSAAHVQDFYTALTRQGHPLPDLTVLTHWHYDHTFGLHAAQGLSIAHQRTNEFLRQQQRLAQSGPYMEQLKVEDPHFRLEYAGQDTLHIQLAELTFTNMLTLDLGQLTARIFHTVSPSFGGQHLYLYPGRKDSVFRGCHQRGLFQQGLYGPCKTRPADRHHPGHRLCPVRIEPLRTAAQSRPAGLSGESVRKGSPCTRKKAPGLWPGAF